MVKELCNFLAVKQKAVTLQHLEGRRRKEFLFHRQSELNSTGNLIQGDVEDSKAKCCEKVKFRLLMPKKE